MSIVAIVVIAALVAGVLFASGQEARVGRSELLDQQTFAYAERAANDAVDAFDVVARDSMAPATVISYTAPADPPLESIVYITRLDSALFQIVAEAKITRGNVPVTQRRIGITLRMQRDDSTARRVSRVRDLAWAALYKM
ncbi:MAG TPA: hypothetical protein VM939_06435 [Gemmatimonadaceae bacterium]|nr:hypothetical protein [Gemmatimonadaceae bacterium]